MEVLSNASGEGGAGEEMGWSAWRGEAALQGRHLGEEEGEGVPGLSLRWLSPAGDQGQWGLVMTPAGVSVPAQGQIPAVR